MAQRQPQRWRLTTWRRWNGEGICPSGACSGEPRTQPRLLPLLVCFFSPVSLPPPTAPPQGWEAMGLSLRCNPMHAALTSSAGYYAEISLRLGTVEFDAPARMDEESEADSATVTVSNIFVSIETRCNA